MYVISSWAVIVAGTWQKEETGKIYKRYKEAIYIIVLIFSENVSRTYIYGGNYGYALFFLNGHITYRH